MYLRHTTRKKDGKVHRYWSLVRSVRVGRRVIQQTVAHLGELDKQGRLAARALSARLIGAPEQAPLFDDGSEHLTVPVRLKGIRIERSRRFGDVYLALALWRGMGLEQLCEQLLPPGKERVGWARMAAVLVTARFCEPSSELHIAEDWYRRTALSDLLQLGEEQVNKDRLYRSLDHLLVHKAALEVHLARRCGELFAVQNEVLLYDVTSTYFEGQALRNPQAQRGYSRDHRPDCKQVCIALVVTFDGFPLGYEVFAGNTHERERDLFARLPVVVGVATARARVEDRAGEYCQGQRTKCDYQREHRLLLSAANGTMEQMPKCGVKRAEPFHTMRTVVGEATRLGLLNDFPASSDAMACDRLTTPRSLRRFA